MASMQGIRVPEGDFTFGGREFNGRLSHIPIWSNVDEDTTTNLDYTTELKATLRNAPPRRMRRTVMDKPHHAIEPSAQVYGAPLPPLGRRPSSIYELTENNPQNRRRSAILARPAHRATTVTEQRASIKKPNAKMIPSPNARPTRPRTSILEQETLQIDGAGDVDTTPDINNLRKEPRRRTIFVPSDDTTIMTIHPGASLNVHREQAKVPHNHQEWRKSFRAETSSSIGRRSIVPGNATGVRQSQPNKAALSARNLGTLHEASALPLPEDIPLPGNDMDLLNEQARIKPKSRKSLAIAPRRAPLGQLSRMYQSAVDSPDRVGAGGGKENCPPGHTVAVKQKSNKVLFDIFSTEDPDPPIIQKAVETKGVTRSSIVKDVTKVRHVDGQRRIGSGNNIRQEEKVTLRNSKSTRNSRLPLSPVIVSKYCGSSIILPTKVERIPCKLSVPKVSILEVPQEHYPVLVEDISRPEMYEENWLNYQEAAITQLINGLFDTADETIKGGIAKSGELRRSFLDLYHDTSFSLLYKRLQASLSFGALSIPKDQMAKALRLGDDLGMRRRFLDLFLNNYEPIALKAGMETVVGREVVISASRCSNENEPNSKRCGSKALRRSLDDFLCTFFIRNEDAVQIKDITGSIGPIARGSFRTTAVIKQESEVGSHGWSWRRTVLRSLMLINLLDKAKAKKLISGCLFRTESPHKSSTAILHDLSRLVLPSMGDITRPLGHLNYQVGYVQYPLQEYEYNITNLATDLRDGVRLTRIVELLLYPTSSLLRQSDITIAMPSGETLTSVACQSGSATLEESWVLSQHLRFPTTGRAQKTYNAQIALSALEGVTRGTANVAGVQAEDIVNGHREKTIGLLWGLVSKWGLGTLVDWNELEREVGRLRAKYQKYQESNTGLTTLYQDESDPEEELQYMEDGVEKHTYLLKTWASCIAKLHGSRVVNLTTSFADGRVFENIVSEYEAFFPQPAANSIAEDGLEGKLRRLGCSTYFAALFGRNIRFGRVFDKDFVIAGLAFMASRLLQASIKGRAALTIQNAWRQVNFRRNIHRRYILLKLAYDCQTVVATRDRVVGAARIIQAAWRRCLHSKIDQLVAEVISFQALARGNLARKRLEAALWVI